MLFLRTSERKSLEKSRRISLDSLSKQRINLLRGLANGESVATVAWKYWVMEFRLTSGN